jgi:predicted aspartyl protease
LGTLTIWPAGLQVQTRPDPNNPKQMQLQIALGGGGGVLATKGIIINVSIGIDLTTADALRSLGQPIPSPITCPALIDTGASILAIDQSLAQPLNLKKRGIITSHTANGPRQCNLFAVALSFPATNLKSYDVIQASEVDLSTQPFKCLIGRDMLSHWHVHYNGQFGTVSIAD